MQTEQPKSNTGHRKKKAARACIHCQKVSLKNKILPTEILIDSFNP